MRSLQGGKWMTTSVSNGALHLSASARSSVAREAYRPDIDGLRAIAAIAVVGVHVGVLPGGFAGVDIFFVISGYLISGLILRALARGSFSSFEFYARRVKRIFPALIVLLVAASVLGWLILLSGEYRLLGREIAEGAGFVYNLTMHWHNNSDLHAAWSRISLGNLWSLGVEEQFYMLWPPFLVLIWKLKSRQLAIIAAVTAISFAINVVEVSLGLHNYSLPEARLWQLSLGGTLAYMQSCRAADLERLRSVLSTRSLSWLGLHNDHARGLIGVALLVASCVVLKDTTAFPGWSAYSGSR
jgi:peptidoglycan/LPS O-acetylase OafA/YrhL